MRAHIIVNGKPVGYRATLCRCGRRRISRFATARTLQQVFPRPANPSASIRPPSRSAMARWRSRRNAMDRFACAATSKSVPATHDGRGAMPLRPLAKQAFLRRLARRCRIYCRLTKRPRWLCLGLAAKNTSPSKPLPVMPHARPSVWGGRASPRCRAAGTGAGVEERCSMQAET